VTADGTIARRTLIGALAAGTMVRSWRAEAAAPSPSTSPSNTGRPPMSNIDRRLAELGITLPTPWTLPPGLTVPASLVRVRGKRVLVSGHVPINPDGSVAGPFGRVGDEVSPEQGQQAARLALIGILASLKEKLGDLDRIAAWLRVYGMVAPAPGFTAFPLLMNGASSLIRDVFGPEIGDHARVAIGVGALPFNVPVEIEAELELA
jgi:enamine deaminase RidA (YjgF/YER057c/UK114 family)